ncbi:glutamate racemase [Inhella proteolytica]|uniref:Glutamate racemase n=1 Tax=Inhella proteolytica TaxID=2795029 RepID=A0A931J6M5_9BURK|nr:glutamate racemase [Inhella proteolytica]MBH9577812.1 glutamate racemase [Inhella proteolytica]
MSASVGVFDSGVGGLSVLAALRDALPGVPLHYIADSANAPYGERSREFITERSLALTQHLRDQGAALVVVACNTATAAAADALRCQHPDLPIVGIEPGIKPAAAASRNGRVGVLATTATVNSARFQALIERHAAGAQITAVACSGVVKHIEEGDLDSPALRELVARYCAPLKLAGVDTALLGCTHYPFIRTLWQAELGPGVQLLQIEEAVALQAARLWSTPLRAAAPAPIRLATTGEPAVLERLAREGLGWEGFALERCTV